MNRLLPIEGLRAYLALWVLVNHVIFYSSAAFTGTLQDGDWRSKIRLLETGPLAVQVFMIISGFVITLLLDQRRESYGPFITRRFFRLYPVYLLLLVLNILADPWRGQTFVLSQHYMDPGSIAYFTSLQQATHNNWWPTLLLHLVMLQGLPHGMWLNPLTSYSFIIAGWSIPVEWEFYLLAPLIYFLVKSPHPLARLSLWAGALLIFLAARHWLYLTPNFLAYLPFFFIGIISYFAYKFLPAVPPDTIFPVTLALGLMLFVYYGSRTEFLPLVIWLPFWGLLCEPAAARLAWLPAGLFNNKVAQFLGACSYGIYLSHEFVILVMQNLLHATAPGLDPTAYAAALLALTIAGTVLFAALLHYLVELPGMNLGRALAAKMPARRPLPAAEIKRA